MPLAYYATGTFARAGHIPSEILWRTLVRRADVVAAEGTEVLEECGRVLRVPAPRLVLAPNGRDTEEFSPRAVSADQPAPEPPLVVFVGALTSGKRPDRFVEVIAALRRQGVALRASLCGDGPLAAELERAARRQAGVEVLGSRSDVAAILRDADVLVFPSLPTGEGMPGCPDRGGAQRPARGGERGSRRADHRGGRGDRLSSSTPTTAPPWCRPRPGSWPTPELRRRMGSAARLRCSGAVQPRGGRDLLVSFLEPLLWHAAQEPRACEVREESRPVPSGMSSVATSPLEPARATRSSRV